MPSPAPTFRPLPAALCNRIRERVDLLAAATTQDAQIAALFLCFCRLKDAEKKIGPRTATENDKDKPL